MRAEAAVHETDDQGPRGRSSPAGATAPPDLPRPRQGGTSLSAPPAGPARRAARSLRRRTMCRLGVHTSVALWAPGWGVWCNHCRSLVQGG